MSNVSDAKQRLLDAAVSGQDEPSVVAAGRRLFPNLEAQLSGKSKA